MTVLRITLAALLPLLTATLAGLAVGWVSRYSYVIGLLVLVLGLVAGAMTGVAELVARGRIGRSAPWIAVASILLGWVAFQWMDDVHFQQTFRDDFAAARFADSGASADEAITDGDIDFYGEDAPDALEDQVVGRSGTGGIVGRWLFRAEAGVRLIGPWNNGRGVAVGLAGAVFWALLEVLLSVLLARLVLGRMRSDETRLTKHGVGDGAGRGVR